MALGAAPEPQVAPALKIERSNVTGLATFVTAHGGGAIGVQPAAGGGRIQPMDFLAAQGHLFGVRDAARELVQSRTQADQLGHFHTNYQQIHKGVPVFSGVLKIHQAWDGSILAGNGDFYPIPNRLDTNPHLTADAAAVRAHAELGLGQPKIEHSELVIVDPGWYGDPPTGARLAYYIILSDMAVPFREAFFVDAHRGRILDQWNLLETSRFRVVTDDTTSTVVRSEGDPPAGDFDADSAYDYSGDWYDYFSRGFGRDSYDDAGGNLTNVVHLVSTSCPNAFGGGGASFFCNGTATDDVIAHEWGHSLTSQTSSLIYQNQAGQLNESYSDIWGEMIDLFNGNASFAGPPGGTSWPTDPTYIGPGTDTPNTLRTGCVSGTFMAVNSPMSIAGDYLAQAASFGPPLTPTGTSGNIVVADPVRGCNADLPFTNAVDMAGKIVLMDRGTCTFAEKVKNAQNAGAIAAIVANNVAGGPAPMGGGDPSITIPSVGITQADGVTIKTAAQSSKVNVTLRTNSSPDVRWLVSEDSSGFGGAIRDMWQPSCSFDPDHANHPFQTCSPTDNGGVHSGSGIPNHAFAMLVDGKTFNGHTVSGIGPIKAAAVWYRAGNVYLTPASNFQDAYTALNQAATDLIGTNIVDPRDGVSTVLFTAADAVEVDDALRAVEMNTPGLCGSWKNVLDSAPVAKCPGRATIYADDFEMGVKGWAVANSGPFGPPTPYDWFQLSGSSLPYGWPGTVWHIPDASIGDCDTVDESAVHTLTSPVIMLPAILFSPTLSFTHYVDVETFFDGGNIKISVNNGPFQLVPKNAFLHNEYNDRLAAGTNTNPLAGEEAWTGFSMAGGQWGTSLIDLSSFVSGGENVQFRFDFGKDGCGGSQGWYVDDFEVYTCPAQAGIRYVNGARPDDSGDGLSWAAAEKTLQAALAAAVSGDQIWVATGAYKPDQGGGQLPGNRSATFQLKNNVAVYGGFAGSETMLTQRDVAANVTILSGDLSGNDTLVFCTSDSNCTSFGDNCLDGTCNISNNNSENSFHVVTGTSAPLAILDGFTVTAGNANGGSPNNRGGGMTTNGGSPTAANCLFTRNFASFGGGGMYDDSNGAKVTACTFLGNTCGNGGGGSGSGGGGLVSNSSNNLTIAKCTFRDNVSKGPGGGGGGGLRLSNNTASTVQNCGFFGNQAFTGGGMELTNSSGGPIVNLAFSGNSADSGGALSVSNGGTLSYCTFSRNIASIDGGGIHTSGNALTVRSSILWENSDAGGMDESAQIHTASGSPAVVYSIVQGGWTGLFGPGNLAASPLFIDANGADNIYGTPDDELGLGSSSPAIDSANIGHLQSDSADLDGDADTAELIPIDLAGNARRVDDPTKPDTGGPAPVPDMGAYERQVNATKVYVDASTVGSDNGSSWTDAFVHLQSALTSASANPQITEIWVADGSYMPDGGRTPTGGAHVNGSGDRAATFQLLNNLAIYGGFAGGETMLSQRDIAANPTTLSGDLLGNDTPVACTQDSPDCDSFGGLCVDGFCTIADNNDENTYHVLTGSGTDAMGILDGFAIAAGNASGPPPEDRGAGLFNDTGSPTVANCTLSGNSAAGHGGGTISFNSNPSFLNCKFRGNTAGSNAGAMFNLGSSPTVANCVFDRNTAQGSAGAMENDFNSSPTVRNCQFIGNSANANGGGMFNVSGSNPAVTNCSFSGNSAFIAGGAMFYDSGSPTLTNCTFSGNIAQFGDGGGIYSNNAGTNPTLASCILWANQDTGGMDESAQIHMANGAIVEVNYSIVQGGWSGAGSNNLDADPAFIDADGTDNTLGTIDDNVRLQAGSPAIDTGNDMGTTAPDLDGNPRIWDGDGDGNATVDMGAYEFSPDCNLNGVQDAADIASGTSMDGNENGIPDECSPFTDGCAPNRAWTCPANWDLSGQYPDDVDSAVGVSVNLPSGAVVVLDESVVIPSLWIQDGGELQMTTHDTILDVDRAILVNGTLTMESCKLAGNTPPTLTIGPGGKFETASCTSEGDPSTMTAAEIRILGGACPTPPCPDGGRVVLEEAISFTSTGVLVIDGSTVAWPSNVSGVTEPPALSVFDNATVTVAAALTMTGAVESTNESTGGVFLRGDWDHQSISPSLFDWTAGHLTLDGSVPQSFEVSGIDLGPTLEGYDTDADALFDTDHHKNFSIGTLEVAAGGDVEFRNDFANTVATGACEEAFYVGSLILESGAQVTLNNVVMYHQSLTNNGATITKIGCGDLLPAALPNDIVWDPATNPIPWPNNNPLATTRSLRFTVTGPAGPSKLEAIKVTMVDLQHPKPANLPAQAPPNLTTYDTRLNGTCNGGTLVGHHCDIDADCPPGVVVGRCSSLAACTADPVCTNSAQCTPPSNSCARWVGKLGTFYEAQGPPLSGPYKAARLQCTPYYWDWKPEVLITVVGADIAPSSEYTVQVYGASCMGAEAGCTAVSPAVMMFTRRSGDVEQPFNPPSASTQPDVTDIAQLVNKFKNLSGALVKAISQLQPNLPELNADINALDIVAVVDSVKGLKWAFSGPCACPSLVTCGATACPSGAGVCVTAYGTGSTCVKTCTGPGPLMGDSCINNTHCLGSGTCGAGFCRDRCGRCN